MVQVAQEEEWQKWRRQELNILGESIAWSNNVFRTNDVGIEGSRHYGTALLEHSIECARAIHLCISKNLPGPAFSLARVQYEGALRGHIIIHEIELNELNELLLQIQQWRQDKQPQRPPPKIEIQEKEWSVTPRTKTGRHLPKKRPLQCETAKIWQESVGEMGLLHDLTHSGMTHALQMLDEERNIGPNYSAMNQTLLLCFADKAVMFAIMMWPGAGQKYWREIEQRVENICQLRSIWEPHIGIPTG